MHPRWVGESWVQVPRSMYPESPLLWVAPLGGLEWRDQVQGRTLPEPCIYDLRPLYFCAVAPIVGIHHMHVLESTPPSTTWG